MRCCCRLQDRASADEEVVEVGDMGALDSYQLDDDAAVPDALAEQLEQFYLNDAAADKEGRPVSFTELLTGQTFDLTHPALDPSFVPAAQPIVQRLSTVGDLSGQTRLDANAFVANIFASMGSH